MAELKPCPFCGGEASNFIAGIYCNECGAGVSRYGKTNEQVVEAWNTRHERTCRTVWHSNEFGLFDLHCSECCSLLLIQRDGSETQPNFCPNCGARVKED